MGPSDDALPAADTPAPRYTVVIPTFERRDVVVGSVTALVEQRYDPGFEVVVVVDGSTDGTAAALRALQVPFPLQVVEQPNLGAARARNNGARCARGEVLLFLDDDMRAAADLLSAHDRAHARGADVVVGHVPLDPSSPRTFLAAGVGEWADRRARRLEQRP